MTSAVNALRVAAARRLAAAGIDSAANDAALLLAHVLGVETGRLLLVDDVSAVQRQAFDDAVERRAARVPLQHITTTAYFAGVELSVGPGVFVPRPETELIVEWAVRAAAEAARRNPDQPVRVADLCSGSGALAIAIAAAAPWTEVLAVERSEAAAKYLAANIAAQPDDVAQRLTLVRGDVTDSAAMALALGERALIVSNPPYVPDGAQISPEVAADPHDAVFSGSSGMDCIDAMTPVIAASLIPGGMVAIEHDDTTADQVVDVLARDGRFTDIVAHHDLTDRPRYVSARRVER